MKLDLTQTRHRFPSAFDALQAATAFEASTATDLQYDVRMSMGLWIVEVRDADTNISLGFLAPAA